jgi:anti-anti-sigma factor
LQVGKVSVRRAVFGTAATGLRGPGAPGFPVLAGPSHKKADEENEDVLEKKRPNGQTCASWRGRRRRSVLHRRIRTPACACCRTHADRQAVGGWIVTKREGGGMAEFDLSGDRLAVNGVLDSNAEGQLRSSFRKLLESDAEVVTVDLSEVKMITSVCIGALVVLWIDLGSAGRRGRLVTSPAVKKVLDMTGLTGVLAGEEGL